MPAAWTCQAQPIRHGSFLQAGLDHLSAVYGGAAQPKDRYACPVCIASGDAGWMRPSSQSEADRLSVKEGV